MEKKKNQERKENLETWLLFHYRFSSIHLKVIVRFITYYGFDDSQTLFNRGIAS